MIASQCHGPGIPLGGTRAIFEPFARGRMTRAGQDGPGTCNCARLHAVNGGRLWIESGLDTARRSRWRAGRESHDCGGEMSNGGFSSWTTSADPPRRTMKLRGAGYAVDTAATPRRR